MTTNPEAAAGPIEVTVTRVLDAPHDLVWKVWTDPAHSAKWWGPAGFTTTIQEWDLRPGGKLVRQMRGLDGSVIPSSGTGIFEEVVAPERLVTSGQLQLPGEAAFDIRTTVTFAEHDGKTTVTVRQVYAKMTAAAAAKAADGARNGWSQSFARLEAYIASL